MAGDDSVHLWVTGIRNGDEAAAQKLWERYFERLLELLQRRLPTHVRRSFDEEDIALSTFRSLFSALSQQRYPQLGDRSELWNLLVTIAARKASSYLRRETQGKRGGGLVRGDSAFGLKGAASESGMEQVLDSEPTPAFAAVVADEFESLLASLGDDTLRSIAIMKMEGYTVEEIAAKLGCARRTVERRLHLIRVCWSESEPPPAIL